MISFIFCIRPLNSIDLLLMYFLSLQSNTLMAEQGRNCSKRVIKPNRFLNIDEGDYGIFQGPRNTQARENRNNQVELNQLGKLLVHFVNNTNKKLRDRASEALETEPAKQNLSSENEKTPFTSKINERKGFNGLIDSSATHNKKFFDNQGRTINDTNRAHKITDKKSSNQKVLQNVSSTIQSDLTYHNMLGEHIKSQLPDLKNISPEMLMQLGLPKQIWDQNLKASQKDKGKKQKEFAPYQIKGGVKEMKQDFKIFKRQSYHVAICYHIHIKHFKCGTYASAKDLDPTANAKRLKQSNNRPN